MMKKYDLSTIHQMSDGDSEFVTEMVRTFVEELPDDVRAMNEAVENGNPELTFQIAHKMKPNLQIFGLDLSMEVKKLEEWAKSYASREDVLPYAEVISETVLGACEEIKKDFKF